MKKGFTLIEIIISITLVLIIGTFTTITNVISNNKKEKTLESMSNDIITAVNLYIETHNDTKKQVYENKNGAIIQLETLQNEGLIDFENISIEDEYVVTMLSTETDCASPEYITSWNFPDNKVLYVCATSTQTTESNLTNQKEYLARGLNPNNYVKIQNDSTITIWRVVEIINGEYKLLASSENMLLTTSNYLNTTEIYDGINERSTTIPNIPNKILKESYYTYQYNSDGGHRGKDTASQFKYQSKVGLINYSSIWNANGTDGSWIFDLLSKYPKVADASNAETTIAIGYTDNYDSYFGCIIKSGTMDIIYTGSEHRCTKNSKNVFMPLITLKSCAKLKVDNSCTTPGSEDCPYLLDASQC